MSLGYDFPPELDVKSETIGISFTFPKTPENDQKFSDAKLKYMQNNGQCKFKIQIKKPYYYHVLGKKLEDRVQALLFIFEQMGLYSINRIIRSFKPDIKSDITREEYLALDDPHLQSFNKTIERTMNFWNETFKNISQDPRSDKFIFAVNDTKLGVPLSYALGLSPFITEQYLKDPTFRVLEIKDYELNADEFSNFLKGKEINDKSFIKIAKILKNSEMIAKWKNLNHINKEEIVSFISKWNLNNQENMDETKAEIEYIARNFEELKEELKYLGDEELLCILRNKSINVKSEDTLWEIIKGRITRIKEEIYNETEDKKKKKWLRNLRRLLLENVTIKYLTHENFIAYIEEIETDDISNIGSYRNENGGNIWNQIQFHSIE